MTVVPMQDPGFVGIALPSAWGADGGGVISLYTIDNAPVSLRNAARLQNLGDNGGIYTEVIPLALATPHVFSVYIKNNGGQTPLVMTVREGSTFSEVAFQLINITSQWVRYSLPFTSHASVPHHLFYVSGQAGTGFDFMVDAYQIETGAVATPYAGNGDPGPAPINVGGSMLLIGVGS